MGFLPWNSLKMRRGLRLQGFGAEYWRCEFSHRPPKQRVLLKQERVAAKCSSSEIVWKHKHRNSTSLSIYFQRLCWTKRGDLILFIWIGNYFTWPLLQQDIIWSMLEERKSNANSLEQLWRSWHFFVNSWLQMVQRLIDWKQEWPHQLSPWRQETTIACSSLPQRDSKLLGSLYPYSPPQKPSYI